MDLGGSRPEAASVIVEPFDKKSSSCRYSENVNCADFADEEMDDVVESFDQLHRSIPWLQKAGVSSESHRGQLQILQAAIDYIIDLEEQLTEHLSGDMYRAAIQSGRAVLEQSLATATAAAAAAGRRPFADVNAGPSSPSALPSPVTTPLLQSPPSSRFSVPTLSTTTAGLRDSIADAEDRQC